MKILPLLLCFIANICYAWNSNGHRLIAQIAYDQLTPRQRQQLNVLEHNKHGKSFVRSATWADTIWKDGKKRYGDWHYIDYPYPNHTSDFKSATPNVVWAIEHSMQVLLSPQSKSSEIVFNLRMLSHLVGDIHQPLHCINRFGPHTPHGDFGGNLFVIHDQHQTLSLHHYWDDGAGLLSHRYSNRQIQHLARQYEQRYPPQYFTQSLHDKQVADWAQHSYALATRYAYQIKPLTAPTAAYNQQAHKIVMQQITLAGYRLSLRLQQIIAVKTAQS